MTNKQYVLMPGCFFIYLWCDQSKTEKLHICVVFIYFPLLDFQKNSSKSYLGYLSILFEK